MTQSVVARPPWSRLAPWAVVVGSVAAVIGVGSLLRSPDRGRADDRPAGVTVVTTAAPAALPAPAVDAVAAHGAVIQYELLGIRSGEALIAPHGGPSRTYRAGDRLNADVVVAAVRQGSVILREGDRVERLSLPPRLGGSGEPVVPGQEGLQPAPQPPSGELSGAVIAARLAAASGAPSSAPLPDIIEGGAAPPR